MLNFWKSHQFLTSSLFSVDRLRNQDTCATAGIEMIITKWRYMPSMRNGRPSLAFFDDWIICENKLISGSMSRENDHLYPTKQRDESRMKDYLCDR